MVSGGDCGREEEAAIPSKRTVAQKTFWDTPKVATESAPIFCARKKCFPSKENIMFFVFLTIDGQGMLFEAFLVQ